MRSVPLVKKEGQTSFAPYGAGTGGGSGADTFA